MIVIDSNMFDYYFDPTTKEHRYVKIELEKIIRSGEKILTNTIIWIEVLQSINSRSCGRNQLAGEMLQ